MSGRTTPIGRISVRVFPELKHFPQDVKRQLREIDSRLPKVKLKVELDANQVVKEARRVAKEASATVNMNVDLHAAEAIVRARGVRKAIEANVGDVVMNVKTKLEKPDDAALKKIPDQVVNQKVITKRINEGINDALSSVKPMHVPIDHRSVQRGVQNAIIKGGWRVPISPRAPDLWREVHDQILKGGSATIKPDTVKFGRDVKRTLHEAGAKVPVTFDETRLGRTYQRISNGLKRAADKTVLNPRVQGVARGIASSVKQGAINGLSTGFLAAQPHVKRLGDFVKRQLTLPEPEPKNFFPDLNHLMGVWTRHVKALSSLQPKLNPKVASVRWDPSVLKGLQDSWQKAVANPKNQKLWPQLDQAIRERMASLKPIIPEPDDAAFARKMEKIRSQLAGAERYFKRLGNGIDRTFFLMDKAKPLKLKAHWDPSSEQAMKDMLRFTMMKKDVTFKVRLAAKHVQRGFNRIQDGFSSLGKAAKRFGNDLWNFSMNEGGLDKVVKGFQRMGARVSDTYESIRVKALTTARDLKDWAAPKLKVAAEWSQSAWAAVKAKVAEAKRSIAQSDAAVVVRVAARNLGAEIAKIKAQVKSRLPSIDLPFKPDLKGFTAAAEKLKARIKAFKPPKVNINTELITRGLGAAAKAAAMGAKVAAGKIVIPVQLGTKGLKAALPALSALSGWRMASDATSGLREFVNEVDKALPKMALMSGAMAHFAGSVISAAPGIASLGVSIAQIAPLALALPGAFLAAGTAAGILMVAMQDFGKRLPQVGEAFKRMKQQISDNFWARALVPMREMFNGALPKIEAGTKRVATATGNWAGNLAKAMQAHVTSRLPGFFDNVAKMVDNASKGMDGFGRAFGILMTVGSNQMPRFGAALADVSNKFGDWLSKAEKSGDLTRWINTAIDRVKDLWNILVQLGRIIEGLFTPLATIGSTTLKTIGDDLRKIADYINRPASQEGLIGFFDKISKVMGEANKYISEGLGRAIVGLGKVADRVFPLLIQGFAAIAGGLGRLIGSPQVVEGLTHALSGVAEIAKIVGGLLPGLAPGLGALLTLIGDLARAFGPVLAGALAFLSEKLVLLQPFISQLAQILSEGLLKILRDLSPVFSALIEAIGPVAVAVVQALIDILSALAPILANALLAVLKEIQPYIPDIVHSITEFGKAIAAMLPDAAKLAGEVLRWLADNAKQVDLGEIVRMGFEMFGMLVQVLPLAFELARAALPLIIKAAGMAAPLVGSIAGAIGDLAGALKPAMEPLGQLGQKLLDLAQPSVKDLSGSFDRLGESFSKASPKLAEFLRNANDMVDSPGFKFLMKVFDLTFVEPLRVAIDLIGNLLEPVFGFLSGLTEALAGLFEGDFPKFMDGLGKMLREATLGLLEALGNTIIEGTKRLGKFLPEGLQKGWDESLDNTKESLRRWCDNVLQAFKDFFGIHSPSTVMAEQGGYIVAGVIDGIGGAAQGAVDAIGNMASAMGAKVSEGFNRLKEDGGRILGDAGRFFSDRVNDAKNWMTDRWREADQASGGKMSDIVNTIRRGAGDLGNAFSSGASNLGSVVGSTMQNAKNQADQGVPWYNVGWNAMVGLYNGLSGMASRIWERARSIAVDAYNAAKNALGIHSPSRLFRDGIGKNIGLGLVEGIDGQVSKVVDSITNMADAMEKAFDPTLEATALTDTSAVRRAAQAASEALGGVQDNQSSGPQFNIVNNYPQAEPTSTTVNRALQLAMLT